MAYKTYRHLLIAFGIILLSAVIYNHSFSGIQLFAALLVGNIFGVIGGVLP